MQPFELSRKSGAALTPTSGEVGLRDRLLQEARSERQRCLEVAEAAERRRSEFRAVVHVGAQTDPVVILDGAGSLPGVTGSSGATSSFASRPGVWTHDDEEAQAEALRTIQLLGECVGDHSRVAENRVSDLEVELRMERESHEHFDSQLAQERSRKEALQQQVLCLEYELDGKEAALQVAERALERKSEDLQRVELQLQSLKEVTDQVARAGGDDVRTKALRTQLVDRERQLQQKDQHIAHLISVLQHRNALDDESTVYGNSDWSINASTPTYSTPIYATPTYKN